MNPGMKRHILNILILLLASTAVLSCSAGMVNELEDIKGQTAEYRLVISGAVSDMESTMPLEDIRIVMTSEEQTEEGKSEKDTFTVYTDNAGLFTINIGGFRYLVSIVLEADDPHGSYRSARHEIPLITWNSNYNMSAGTFYINDCNFYMEKK